VLKTDLDTFLKFIDSMSNQKIDCKYYVPAWAGNKTSGSQPDFCLKHRVVLRGKCIKSCKEQNK